MKKVLKIISLLLLSIILCGCIAEQSSLKRPIPFYYVSQSIEYGDAEGYIQAEQRECVHCNNISEIISLYMSGPISEDLYSPFPSGVRILLVEESGSTITLTISDQINKTDKLSINLSCACLAYTILSATPAQTVVIRAERGFDSIEGYLTYTKEGLLFFDQPLETTPE